MIIGPPSLDSPKSAIGNDEDLVAIEPHLRHLHLDVGQPRSAVLEELPEIGDEARMAGVLLAVVA